MFKNKTVHFICVGAQKAGTSTLHDVLYQHPNICLPKVKETQFFLNLSEYEKGISYYFEKYFLSCSDSNALLGEIDPELLFSENAPQRLFETLGSELKILIILRDPVKRAYSQYQMSKSRGLETLSFLEAIELEQKRIVLDDTEKGSNSKRKHFSYIARGLYVQQIKRYFNYWDRSNIKIVIFEELMDKKKKGYEGILEFIGATKTESLMFDLKSNYATETRAPKLSKLINTDNPIRNAVGKFIPPSFKPAIVRMLRKSMSTRSKNKLNSLDEKQIYQKYFKSEINDLENLLDRDLSFWRK